jgi:Holliday junction resolvase-like predicted endonuclease
LSIEREVLISVLKLAVEGPVSYELINKDANVPTATVQKLLQRLQGEGLLYVRGWFVDVDSAQRLKLAIRAIQLGADMERVSRHLRWNEFENFAAISLEQDSYAVTRNLRFKQGGRRWEIDVIGSKRPLMVCIDCKHWSRGLSQAPLRKIVDEQVERTSALARTLPLLVEKLEVAHWEEVKLVPVVLTMATAGLKFHENVPIVPVLQFQNFLTQLPAHVDSLLSIQASTKFNAAT